MILTPSEMQAAESAVFAGGVRAEDLMEKAGWGIACALRDHFPRVKHLVAYLGKGHNAGDALVAGRHLRAWGWDVALREVAPVEASSPLTQKKHAEFLASHHPACEPNHGDTSEPVILLDGLLGIGARGPLRGAFQSLCQEINTRRQSERATVVAIDIPTGLNGETGDAAEDALHADLTLTIAYAKSGLLADQALPHVGTLALVPLPEILPPTSGGDAGARLITVDPLRQALRRRPVDHYKNRAGHVAVLAGSRGYTGAAAMTAEAALTAGAGLVSLHVPESIYPIMATRCAPEIMVHPLPARLTPDTFLGLAADVFAMGPGLGSSPSAAYMDWLQREQRPTVIDADGLNLLARHKDERLAVATAGPRLLTPHPGEFARLFPEESICPTRRERAEAVVKSFPYTLLYKGARTLVAHSGEPIHINITGNPGMATGGMGDVLTGVCAGIAAQGYAFPTSACLGAWLCGHTADLAVQHGLTHETLRATDIITGLAASFRELQ